MTRTLMFGIRKIFIALFIFFAFCSAALAQESLITSVAISKPSDLHGAYKLTIQADKPVEYKAKADNSDSIYFDLKNALTVDNLDTIYDNVSGIDAVIVQQLENSKVRIYVNGINTASTQLVFKTAQQTGSNATNQVVINRPMREYRPTSDFNEITQEDIDWSDNSFNPEHLLSSFFGMFEGRADMTFAICLVLLVLSVVISKKVFAKVRLQEEPLIGLSSTYQKQALEEELPEVRVEKKEQPVQKVQDVIQKRPQTRQASYYATSREMPRQNYFDVQKNALKRNYALGAYRDAQKNPYTTQKPLSPQVSYQKRVQNPSRQFVSSPQQREIPQPVKKTASIENIKFLESVTKIYEQSGRKDLAQGLRAGLNKKKSAV